MIIAVSKLSPNYEKWLRKINAEVEIIDLYTLPDGEVKKAVIVASGVLLTGGSDIHPKRYGRPEDLPWCLEIDEKRDELEIEVIDLAFQRRLPVLGICRGQQMLNVAGKGSLYADIPNFLNTAIAHAGSEDVYHEVRVNGNSLLYRISGVSSGIVNSSHHQAVNRLADGYSATAYSSDGVVEAIEIGDTSLHQFCLAVQWHPERMEFSDPLSGRIGMGFIEASQKSRV